jgi:putative sigma-54 modulation protein
MRNTIKATNFELTPAITDYIEKRFSAFDKFVSHGDPKNALCEVEVGKTTRHHKSGDVFRAEVNLTVSGKNFFAVSEKDDLYAAIDEVKDEIVQAITTDKDKSMTLYRRGALRVKNILKGLDIRSKFKKK